MKTAKDVRVSDLQSALLKGQKALIQLVDECTDDFAKATAKQVMKQATKSAKDMKVKFVALQGEAKQVINRVRREAPIMIKKASKEATKMMIKIQKDAKIIYDKSLKPIVDNQIWGEIAAEFANHEITALVQDLINLIRKGATIVLKETTKVYNKAVTKAITFFNAKFPELKKQFEKIKARVMAVWNAKLPVVMKKFEQLKKLIIAKFNELKAEGLKKFAELKTKYEALKKELMNLDLDKQIALLEKFALDTVADLKKTTAELQKIAIANLENMKKQTIALYNKAYAAAYKFFDETKLVDIENFVYKVIGNVEQLIQVIKAKLVYLRDNYKVIAKKYIDQGVKLFNEYKTKAIAFLKEYEAVAMKIVNSTKAK